MREKPETVPRAILTGKLRSMARSRTADEHQSIVTSQGDPRLSDEEKAQLAAIGGSDELQDALEEASRQYPELS